ncbi:ribonuclease H-like domain-containing protein [Tanacetum coccineum]
MSDEYNALIKNGTWTLMPRPMDVNVVRCMWLFRHKFLADGTLTRYKAWLVANGSTQVEGIDVDETFSPIVKPSTIQTVLSLAILNIAMFINLMSRMLSYMGTHTTYLLLYVDDIVLTASSETFLKYAMKILERAHTLHCNPSRTLVDTESKLSDDGAPVSDPTLFQSLANWDGCPTTRRSTSEYYVFLDNNLLAWPSKRQSTLSRSSAEAKYRGVANVVDETCWLRNLP